MRNKYIDFILFVIGVLAVSFGLGVLSDDASSQARKVWEQCPFDELEGASKCVWDAQHNGTDYGRSFFINDKGLHYIVHWRAHRMLGLD